MEVPMIPDMDNHVRAVLNDGLRDPVYVVRGCAWFDLCVRDDEVTPRGSICADRQR